MTCLQAFATRQSLPQPTFRVMAELGARLTKQEVDEAEVNRLRKQGSRRKEKSSLAASIANPKKLKSKVDDSDRDFKQRWNAVAGDLSEDDQRKAVEQAIEVFKLLPPASQYAQHRLRVLHQALELLNKNRQGSRIFPLKLGATCSHAAFDRPGELLAQALFLFEARSIAFCGLFSSVF